jgi:hypothetical protein
MHPREAAVILLSQKHYWFCAAGRKGFKQFSDRVVYDLLVLRRLD